MNLLQSLRAGTWPPSGAFVDAFVSQLNAGGLSLSNQTLGRKIEDIDADYQTLALRAYASSSVVFACMSVRASLFSEANFQWRQVRNGKPGDLFGTQDLAILEHPWPNGTTGDLLNVMINHADLGGNSFILRQGDTLMPLRPDWTTIVHGSPDPNGSMWDPDATLLGYGYQPGGPALGARRIFFTADRVAHFAPVRDPLATYRGMSWLTPIIREVMADQAATEHKLAFFENGATANLLVKVNQPDRVKFKEFIEEFEQQHVGSANAYRTLYLNPGVDATVIGANLQQAEFKVTQGAGETRIAAAAGTPPVIVGLSEGLQGSALNAGNYASSMRRFADLTMHTLWRNACGSLETICKPPPNSELWFDSSDIPALRVDRTDAAQIEQTKAITIKQYIDAGFTAQSAVDAVVAEDITLLKHTGLFSKQLQAPGAPTMPAGEVPGEVPVGEGTQPEVLPGDESTKPLSPEAAMKPPTNGKAPVGVAGRALEQLLSERSDDV